MGTYNFKYNRIHVGYSTVCMFENGKCLQKKEIEKLINECDIQKEFVLYEGNDDRQNLLEKGTTSPDDMLLTFDLHGFEWCTLTDNISYNILPCKQIHIITKDNLPNERYLDKQLSISMFFYCTDSKYYQYLHEKYPNIPYLKEVKGWNDTDDEESTETNAKILSEIIEEVMQICHMT